MDLFELAVANKLAGGGGGDIDVDALNVTENGVYSASSGHAFDPVTVSVPQGVFPSGTSQITSNGIYDVSNFASASVNVPIPSGYIQPTGTSSITANGLYDITSFASVDVNVSGGGGWTIDDLFDDKISGAVTITASTIIKSHAFYSNKLITSITAPNVRSVGVSAFQYCTSLKTATFGQLNQINASAFKSCGIMSLYILASSVANLQNSNVFQQTPILNSVAGAYGSIYVPASLVDSYKASTNWSYYSDRITSYVE